MKIRFSAELYQEMAAIWSYPAVDKIKWEILEGKVNAKNIINQQNMGITNFEVICIDKTWKMINLFLDGLTLEKKGFGCTKLVL